ncbi:MAG: methyltransferase domain-containing protein [Bacteroidota bacterium]|jgi:spermidine synthase
MRALKRLLGRRGEAVEVSEARGVRTLHLGGQAIQSALRLSAPDRLELAYTRAMMAFLLFVPAPREILMVGLGGGSIARFVHERLPRTRFTGIELNPKVVAAARAFFGLPADDRRLKVIVGDGAEHVPAYRGTCDVVLLDAFDNLRSVRSLATETFYADCRDALRSGGVFVVNFIADEPRFGTYLARLERVFDGRVLCLPSQDRMNMIVLGFRDRADAVPIAPLKRTARELERRLELPFDRFVRDLVAHNPGDARHLGFRHDET